MSALPLVSIAPTLSEHVTILSTCIVTASTAFVCLLSKKHVGWSLDKYFHISHPISFLLCQTGAVKLPGSLLESPNENTNCNNMRECVIAESFFSLSVNER
ncbi:hypothetical protein ATANTOWER_006621 [Ataeniobius toweri]|uniref:Uncharacterized protein n=1 Tax=Ataeniobius toweri TaxID=208326 RepID=A0ABU7AFG4_9TELE|nr:hypothetical protein [Ataeniobius toweri]